MWGCTQPAVKNAIVRKWTRTYFTCCKLLFNFTAPEQGKQTNKQSSAAGGSLTGSDYSDTSAGARSAVRLLWPPAHTDRARPRWTGLVFPISFPPPTTEQASLWALGLCASWNEVRWSIALKISPKVLKWSSVAPVYRLEFFNFPPRRKTNGWPFIEPPLAVWLLIF